LTPSNFEAMQKLMQELKLIVSVFKTRLSQVKLYQRGNSYSSERPRLWRGSPDARISRGTNNPTSCFPRTNYFKIFNMRWDQSQRVINSICTLWGINDQ
ncbi:hypothetical protein OAI26_02635, partial [Sulfitobacter sp.]|nr:hypothetical protein [Sulfitobacter sp.]